VNRAVKSSARPGSQVPPIASMWAAVRPVRCCSERKTAARSRMRASSQTLLEKLMTSSLSRISSRLAVSVDNTCTRPASAGGMARVYNSAVPWAGSAGWGLMRSGVSGQRAHSNAYSEASSAHQASASQRCALRAPTQVCPWPKMVTPRPRLPRAWSRMLVNPSIAGAPVTTSRRGSSPSRP
jgi:hypothetical protein